MKLKAVVEINLVIDNGETFDEANERLYDLLFDGLCRNANCDFLIESIEEND